MKRFLSALAVLGFTVASTFATSTNEVVAAIESEVTGKAPLLWAAAAVGVTFMVIMVVIRLIGRAFKSAK